MKPLPQPSSEGDKTFQEKLRENLHTFASYFPWKPEELKSGTYNTAIDEAEAAILQLIDTDVIGGDEDNYSSLKPGSLSYKELKRVAEVANHLRAAQRQIIRKGSDDTNNLS